MSIDVASAEFLAALLKTLSETDASFRSRLQKHLVQLTAEEILETLKTVKGIQGKTVPPEWQLREEIENFLAYRE